MTKKKEEPGRLPPQAVEIEQSILGSMLLEKSAVPQVIEILEPEDFYSAKHKLIYEAMLGLFEGATPIDLITTAEELQKRGNSQECGGAYYLTELTSRVDAASNIEYHARIVAEKSLLRKLIKNMNTLTKKAYDPSTDAFELLDETEREIFQISDTSLRKPAQSINMALKNALANLESVHGKEDGITGVPSGFSRLDSMTGGWQNTDLIIIAARPSMGKTAFSLAMARNAALHPTNPVGVAIFSLEMGSEQLAQRLLTSEARVSAQAARTGRLADEDWPRIARAAGSLGASKIYIDDTPSLGILELRAKCRRLKSEHDIGLVIIDYLQLMTGPVRGRGNREQEIAQISRSLKGLAKELDVPVIALAQLSRAVEARGGDKRPQLSDLRESGSIEQDADVVAFIYRAERYGITVDDDGNSTEGIGEIIIAKQRNGPIGDIKLGFVSQYARFENLQAYYTQPDQPGLPAREPVEAPF